jgi:hypothetical protein
VSAASAAAHAETFHTLSRIPRLPSEIRRAEYPCAVAAKPAPNTIATAS